jgi:TRAP-type C4-dicarboxylate transport system substrate-binding protein
MNKDKWDSLGADLQKVFTAVAAKYQPLSAVNWNNINVLGFQTAVAQGAEYITLSTDEAARWKAAVQPVLEAYVTKMVGKGFVEQTVRDQLAYIKDRLAYWTQQAAAQNIPSEAYVAK